MANHRRAVLVGLGNTDEGVPELAWAAAEARARGCVLHVVRAWNMSSGTAPWQDSIDREIESDLRRSAASHLERAAAYVAGTWPDVEVEPSVAAGVPWQVLARRSAQAEVTVLGSRHLGTVRGALLGSVSTAVAAHASGPVVVVRGPAADPAENASVVVGVDGSAAMTAVLAFAFDHASRHRTALHAVFCYSPDLLATAQWRSGQPAPERADRWLAEMLAGWQEKYPDVAVHRGVVREHPVPGLVAESHAQTLLVVGNHARHVRGTPLLGSVSQGVLHHATCPVAVVHPSRRAAAPEASERDRGDGSAPFVAGAGLGDPANE
jgi:nucleotide-binding universal stress UspA family protein